MLPSLNMLREQAAEKTSYASLRSIASLQRTGQARLRLASPERSRWIDFSRASPLSLFEQPARECFVERSKAVGWVEASCADTHAGMTDPSGAGRKDGVLGIGSLGFCVAQRGGAEDAE
jgi:hypothetical protein